MYCSGCGFNLAQGQAVCPQCGRPIAPPIPPIPNMQMQVATYASRIRALSIVWFIYGGLGLVFGFLGLAFANAALHGSFGPWGHLPWSHEPFGPDFLGPQFLHLIWVLLVVRSAVSFFAGWGLMQRASWGRIIAIVAAFLNILKFPFGTALAIWTLVTLMGYRNSTLYEQLGF
jgi:hypothetical protein